GSTELMRILGTLSRCTLVVVCIEVLGIGVEDTFQLVQVPDRLDHALLSECPDEPLGPAVEIGLHLAPGSCDRPADGSRFGCVRCYGTVLRGPLEDLPDWLPAWCLDHLGGEPVGVMFWLHQVSMVFGLRLAGGTDVVVKARADDGRAVSCVAVQARLAE